MTKIFNDAFFNSLDSSILPVDEAEMLPPACYTDANFFEFEKEHIFAHEWLCVGRKEWVEKPGDYFTGMHMGEPFVVVHGRDGVIRAMSTVCQHRAMLVAEGHGNTRTFLCPYHHWAYALDGQLIGAPAMERACKFDKADIKLPNFKVELWLGFIFINLDENAAPLAPRLEKVAEVLKNYDLENADTSMDIEEQTFPWNWKVMFENNNDGYHANRLHAGPVHDIAPSDLCSFPDDLPADTAGYYRYNATVHADASFNPTLHALLPVFPKLTDEDRNRLLFANVPPSLSLIIRSDLVAFIILHANTHDTITAKRGWLAAPGAKQTPLFEEKLAINLTTSAEIAAQDIHVDELIPYGLRSRFAVRGRYSWQERAQLEFNSWLVPRYKAAWEEMKKAQDPA
ncbi:(2Fe-2S)-binding protein [Croceicoccus estronivorus]|uniref:aromatic ring-hydroxylating oxygenase subunit alpha n=1 Tax=Croceicoccus estronivorus TaxID=1172626 RepID=UPI00082CE731|nr:aromatic ring-hydroxylating dioxygenase subunit alpha [Croceicoccus estronivorus]OCC24442.1 (2Fe-2S)-binding protein [Croceicoccus estronivorus]